MLEKLPRISKATVYKNLRYLAEIGRIREVNIKGVLRFEPNLKPHHHLICRNCEKIIDFDSQELIEYSLQLVKNLKEFDIDTTTTTFYGLCKRCKQKEED